MITFLGTLPNQPIRNIGGFGEGRQIGSLPSANSPFVSRLSGEKQVWPRLQIRSLFATHPLKFLNDFPNSAAPSNDCATP